MNILKNTVVKYLQDTAESIDKNTCEVNDEELQEILKCLAHRPLSKEQACNYMHMSRSTFDTKVKNNELPKGRKRSGFKELVWYQDELDECTLNLQNEQR